MNPEITRTKDVCGGDACIAGTRVNVWAIIGAFKNGHSVRTLTKYFCRELTTKQVEAAIRYYMEHPEEIQGDYRRCQQTRRKL